MTARTRLLLVGVGVLLLLSGCAAEAQPDAGSGDAGFWLGLWQGLILPVTFVVSLFNDEVAIMKPRDRARSICTFCAAPWVWNVLQFAPNG